MKKHTSWSRNKRALSPIFATVILVAIVVIFGSFVYYFSNNIVTTTTNDYVSTISNSQQSVSERIGFENVVYSPSSPPTLTIYIINCGSANNIKINSVFIYDSNHSVVGQPYSGTFEITPIDGVSPTPYPGNSLNVGKEGYFTITLNGPALSTGSIYTIHLITQSGSSFDYDFTP